MSPKAAIYNILVFRFKGKDAADRALADLKKGRKEFGYKIIDGAVMRSDEKGKISYHETADLSASQGAGIGALGGAVLGLLGGPAGLVVATAAGAITGAAAAHFTDMALPDSQLKEIASSLSPDSSAIIALVEDRESEKAIDSITGLNAEVMTFTLGDEVSGDVSMAVAGQISFEPLKPPAEKPKKDEKRAG
ncbi:MAG TPA: DUF1269 domain-containing protein [Anaerolineales bacterium]|nr:DUF1269 domain-containing protein [Anaerolineales bacterium]